MRELYHEDKTWVLKEGCECEILLSEKKLIRLEIASNLMAAIASNINFRGDIKCISEYVKWADRLIKANEEIPLE